MIHTSEIETQIKPTVKLLLLLTLLLTVRVYRDWSIFHLLVRPGPKGLHKNICGNCCSEHFYRLDALSEAQSMLSKHCNKESNQEVKLLYNHKHKTHRCIMHNF